MGNKKGCFACHSCGTAVEYCAEEVPCAMLRGWVSIAYWKDVEKIERYNFCSISCLKTWLEAQITQIPDSFLKSFKEDEG